MSIRERALFASTTLSPSWTHTAGVCQYVCQWHRLCMWSLVWPLVCLRVLPPAGHPPLALCGDSLPRAQVSSSQLLEMAAPSPWPCAGTMTDAPLQVLRAIRDDHHRQGRVEIVFSAPTPPHAMPAAPSTRPQHQDTTGSFRAWCGASKEAPAKRPAPPGPASAPRAKKKASPYHVAKASPYHEFCREQRPLLPPNMSNADREKLLGEFMGLCPCPCPCPCPYP